MAFVGLMPSERSSGARRGSDFDLAPAEVETPAQSARTRLPAAPLDLPQGRDDLVDIVCGHALVCGQVD
jgi:hypothetical protein